MVNGEVFVKSSNSVNSNHHSRVENESYDEIDLFELWSNLIEQKRII